MTRKKIIKVSSIAMAAVALIYGIYEYTRNDSANNPESAGTQTDLEKKLSGLSRLKGSKLDTSLFQDPVFKMLESPANPSGTSGSQSQINAGEVSEIKIGRTNPFNPF